MSQWRLAAPRVGFHYRLNHPLLTEVDFDIPAGSRVAIVGSSGSGKTTLVSLLLRAHDVLDGSICIDNVDVRDYDLDNLRRQFSVVMQDSVLFERSIAENIGYGSDIGRAEIIAAARKSGAHDFIMALPETYNTIIGERGLQLSGGERQRIALARMFAREAPLLILDEPTNAIDERTAEAINKALARFAKDRTIFLIAHNARVVGDCHLVLQIEEGRVKVYKGREAKVRVQPPGRAAIVDPSLCYSPLMRQPVLRPAHPRDFPFCARLYFAEMDHIITQLGLETARQRENLARQWHVAEVRIITMAGEDIGWLDCEVAAAIYMRSAKSPLFLPPSLAQGAAMTRRSIHTAPN